jgi:2-C-methyl-D-erythritol 4-phosphate cytidylyltransferase / 2-C-methyl-D-erythritol 2,4-cyclodiphosphate synthase
MTVAALIVAAGRGSRAGSATPKQYQAVAGHPVLTQSLATLLSNPKVDSALVVIHDEDRNAYEAASAPYAARLREPALGGARRQDSVLAGLEALAADSPDLVLIHDAARPFLPAAVIDRVVDALEKHEGALPALPVTDTLKRADGARIEATVDRAGLWRAQTPQGFRFDRILEAHKAAARTGHSFTDDAAVAEWFGLDMVLVEGAEENRKITTAADLALTDALMRLREGGMQAGLRVGTGFDVHAFGSGDHVVLCGVRIAHNKALVGHSDADVAMHALTDAILGAIADGDIGEHFPPSDARWKGAASEVFLKFAAERVAAKGGRVLNTDLTILCEAPRIGPHRAAMQACLASILGLEPERIGIKATTTEGLGFVGRGEGIAAMATATVLLP